MTELQRRQFAGHRGFQLARGGRRAPSTICAPRPDKRRERGHRGLGAAFSRAAAVSAPPAWPRTRRSTAGKRIRRRRHICAPAARSANSRSSLRSSTAGSVSRLRQQRIQLAPRLFGHGRRPVPARLRRRRRACAPLRSGATVSSAPTASAASAPRSPDSASAAADTSSAMRDGVHHHGALAGQRFLLARLRREIRQVRRRRRARNRHRLRPRRPCAFRSASALARAASQFGEAAPRPRAPALRARRRRPAARDGWRRRTGRDRRPGHALPAAAAPRSFSRPTPTASSLTKARVRPSAASVRRSTISPSAGIAWSAQQARTRDGRARARTRRWPSLARRRAAPRRGRRRVRRPPVPRHPAGWICPRRSRRSAHSGPARIPAPPARSARCRGPSARRASANHLQRILRESLTDPGAFVFLGRQIVALAGCCRRPCTRRLPG